MGLTTRCLLLSDSCECVDVGRSLWRENGSDVYNCCWPSPAQPFSGPSPVELVTVFYCLRFETSLFLASYDSQGYSGGIRPRLQSQSSKLLYDWRFTANQFVLASSPLRLTTRDVFSQRNPCDISPYITSSLTRRWVCLLWICLAFRHIYIYIRGLEL
jgi:hypothetical protein